MLDYVHFQSFAANPVGRDFALADLHGCYSALERAMEDVGFDPGKDRIFSVGDIVDRGPNSLACLRLLKEPWFHAVQGNHENMMLMAIQAGAGSEPWMAWMANGGDWFERLSRIQAEEVRSLLPEVARLPIMCTLTNLSGEKIGISHAQPPLLDWDQVMEGRKLTDDEIWRALWSRELIRSNGRLKVKGVDVTVHGHTIVKQPKQVGNMLFTDTGAYLGKAISLLELTDVLSDSRPE